MSGKKKGITPEDVMTIARYLVRYAGCKPKIAMQRLMEVELIRNNYTKASVYNFCIGTRRLIKDGSFGSGMTKEMADAVRKVLNEQTAAKNEPVQAEPQESPTEVLVRLKKNYDETYAKYDDIVAKLQDEKDAKIAEYDNAMQLVRQQQQALGMAFQKMCSELMEVEARGLLWQK